MWRGRGYDYDQRDYRPREDPLPNRSPRGYSAARGPGYDAEMRDMTSRHRGYDRNFGSDARGPRSYGRDYWWIGEHEFRGRNRPGPYDAAYRRFSEEHHPRFSPVGGMYPAVGGRYIAEGPPRPLREYTRFSDWTRWF